MQPIRDINKLLEEIKPYIPQILKFIDPGEYSTEWIPTSSLTVVSCPNCYYYGEMEFITTNTNTLNQYICPGCRILVTNQ